MLVRQPALEAGLVEDVVAGRDGALLLAGHVNKLRWGGRGGQAAGCSPACTSSGRHGHKRDCCWHHTTVRRDEDSAGPHHPAPRPLPLLACMQMTHSRPPQSPVSMSPPQREGGTGRE